MEPYPGSIGVKNGYTTNAGNTLVAAARHGGRTLVVTVMNPQDGGGLTVYEEARSLLDWGFAAAGHVDAVGTLLDTRSVRPAPRPDARPPRGRGAARPAGPRPAGRVGDRRGGGPRRAAVALALRLLAGRTPRG